MDLEDENYFKNFNNVYPYIISEVKKYNEVFIQLGILDILDLYWSKHEEVGTNAYKVLICCKRTQIRFLKLIKNLVLLLIYIVSIYLVYRFLIK